MNCVIRNLSLLAKCLIYHNSSCFSFCYIVVGILWYELFRTLFLVKIVFLSYDSSFENFLEDTLSFRGFF
jgi:hypothetical protein